MYKYEYFTYYFDVVKYLNDNHIAKSDVIYIGPFCDDIVLIYFDDAEDH